MFKTKMQKMADSAKDLGMLSKEQLEKLDGFYLQLVKQYLGADNLMTRKGLTLEEKRKATNMAMDKYR